MKTLESIISEEVTAAVERSIRVSRAASGLLRGRPAHARGPHTRGPEGAFKEVLRGGDLTIGARLCNHFAASGAVTGRTVTLEVTTAPNGLVGVVRGRNHHSHI